MARGVIGIDAPDADYKIRCQNCLVNDNPGSEGCLPHFDKVTLAIMHKELTSRGRFPACFLGHGVRLGCAVCSSRHQDSNISSRYVGFSEMSKDVWHYPKGGRWAVQVVNYNQRSGLAPANLGDRRLRRGSLKGAGDLRISERWGRLRAGFRTKCVAGCVVRP